MGKLDLDTVHRTVLHAVEDGLQCSGRHINPARKGSSILDKECSSFIATMSLSVRSTIQHQLTVTSDELALFGSRDVSNLQ
jgi:hypothetical protein